MICNKDSIRFDFDKKVVTKIRYSELVMVVVDQHEYNTCDYTCEAQN